MENKNVKKIFHFALTDVAFFKTSLNIVVSPFCCTKVMSKLIRTYTQSHGLKDLHAELLGVEIEKEQQQTNWADLDLSPKQLKYAANDVLRLLEIHDHLQDMIEKRVQLQGGKTVFELNQIAQSMLPGMVDLLIHGYGDLDRGWQTTLFSH
jgi:ribonuclease D